MSDTQKLLTAKGVLASPVYEILKNFSENFSKPITLSFAFDLTSVKGNHRAAADEAKKVWMEVPGSKVDDGYITVEVNHFTKYAVFAVDQAADKPLTLKPAGSINCNCTACIRRSKAVHLPVSRYIFPAPDE